MSIRVFDKEKQISQKSEHKPNETSDDKEVNISFLDFLNNGIDNIAENYMAIIKKIHKILADCPDLTKEQKLDYCNIERYFIKLYLKEAIS